MAYAYPTKSHYDSMRPLNLLFVLSAEYSSRNRFEPAIYILVDTRSFMD